MERALGHHDTERKKAFLMMKAPAAMGKVTTQDSWVPFHIDVVQWMIPQNTMDMSEYLCQYIASSTVVGGAELFWDIVCPETSNIVSKQFDDYGMMSIGTQTKSFFRNFYRLDKAERKLLDRSAKLVFDLLLVGFRMEMKKNKSKMARSFHAWVYLNILCHPDKVSNFMSSLPPSLQCNFQHGPAFLFEIICDMFTKMVCKATHDLTMFLRSNSNPSFSQQETGIVQGLHSGSGSSTGNTDERNSDAISFCYKDQEISEIQNFMGWAIKELIDDTRMEAQEEKLEGVCYDIMKLTEKDHCYQMVKSMRILHQECVKDQEYLMKYYPIFVAAYNKGGLCLVAKHMFPFAQKMFQDIHSCVTREKLAQGDHQLIKNAHERLLHDDELYNLFLDCVTKG